MWSRLIKKGIIRHRNTNSPKIRISLRFFACLIQNLLFAYLGKLWRSKVVRFRSRALSPTLDVERRYRLWITPHRTIEETFCCMLWRVNRYFLFTTCLKSTDMFCWRVRVHEYEFWFWNRLGVHVFESVKVVQSLCVLCVTKICPATPNVRVDVKKIVVPDFLNFPLSNRKKIRASRDFYLCTGSGNVAVSSKKSLF